MSVGTSSAATPLDCATTAANFSHASGTPASMPDTSTGIQSLLQGQVHSPVQGHIHLAQTAQQANNSQFQQQHWSHAQGVQPPHDTDERHPALHAPPHRGDSYRPGTQAMEAKSSCLHGTAGIKAEV